MSVCQLIVSLSNTLHLLSNAPLSSPHRSGSNDTLIAQGDSYSKKELYCKISIDARAEYSAIFFFDISGLKFRGIRIMVNKALAQSVNLCSSIKVSLELRRCELESNA